MSTEKQQHDAYWQELNNQCLACMHECKQSSKVELVVCPRYINAIKK